MKGSIFKHFEAFVAEHWGEEFWESILDRVQLETEGPFLGPAHYPDQDLLTIVGTTVAELGVPLPEALRLFGRFLFHKLEGEAPQFVSEAPDLLSFLQTVDGVIHVEVQKLSPEAYLPSIRCEPLGPGSMRMHYRSQRPFCQLFLGLVEGAAQRFDASLERFHESACTHRGDAQCTFEFHFQQAA